MRAHLTAEVIILIFNQEALHASETERPNQGCPGGDQSVPVDQSVNIQTGHLFNWEEKHEEYRCFHKGALHRTSKQLTPDHALWRVYKCWAGPVEMDFRSRCQRNSDLDRRFIAGAGMWGPSDKDCSVSCCFNRWLKWHLPVDLWERHQRLWVRIISDGRDALEWYARRNGTLPEVTENVNAGRDPVLPTHWFICGVPPQYPHWPPHIDNLLFSYLN